MGGANGGRLVGRHWFLHYQCGFWYRKASGRCLWRLRGFLEGEEGKLAAFFLRARERGTVGWVDITLRYKVCTEYTASLTNFTGMHV